MARELLALVLVFFAIVSTIALFAPNAGAIVRPWHDLLGYLLGWGIAFAPPLLAGFALMLWMKTMPAERWMAASGAALVALALLGAFHLAAGGGIQTADNYEGGGVVGYGVSVALRGALGIPGAWAVLSLLLVVGLLLYFNMTVGDLVAAYLQEREERRADAQPAPRAPAAVSRRADPEPAVEPDRPGILGRVRDALMGASEDDEPPLIVRRQRPPETGTPAMPRPAVEGSLAPVAVAPPRVEAEGSSNGRSPMRRSPSSSPRPPRAGATTRPSRRRSGRGTFPRSSCSTRPRPHPPPRWTLPARVSGSGRRWRISVSA